MKRELLICFFILFAAAGTNVAALTNSLDWVGPISWNVSEVYFDNYPAPITGMGSFRNGEDWMACYDDGAVALFHGDSFEPYRQMSFGAGNARGIVNLPDSLYPGEIAVLTEPSEIYFIDEYSNNKGQWHINLADITGYTGGIPLVSVEDITYDWERDRIIISAEPHGNWVLNSQDRTPLQDEFGLTLFSAYGDRSIVFLNIKDDGAHDILQADYQFFDIFGNGSFCWYGPYPYNPEGHPCQKDTWLAREEWLAGIAYTRDYVYTVRDIMRWHPNNASLWWNQPIERVPHSPDTRWPLFDELLWSFSPRVNLTQPQNSYVFNTSSVLLGYSVIPKSGVPISKCDLYLGETGNYTYLNDTHYSVPYNTEQFFNVALNNGDYEWFVTCEDIDSQSGTSLVGNFTVEILNQAPVLQPIGNKSVKEKYALYFKLNATDPDGDNLTYYTNADAVLPSSFTFHNDTGLFVWTPRDGEFGNYLVNFNVTDGELWDSEEISIEVNDSFTIAPPDYDSDGDIDQSDFGHFQVCFGSLYDGCGDCDFTNDNYVNLSDFIYFQACVSGPTIPYDPNCLESVPDGFAASSRRMFPICINGQREECDENLRYSTSKLCVGEQWSGCRSDRADVNQDGIVDAGDYEYIWGHIGEKHCDDGNNWCERADASRNGVVNAGDIVYVRKKLTV